jgi:hypothetical protein
MLQMNNEQTKYDEAILHLLKTSNGPVSLSGDGSVLTIEQRAEAIRQVPSEPLRGSCYSHSSWGN